MKALTRTTFVLILLFYSSSLFAQSSAQATATVSAQLVKGLAISHSAGTLNFGEIILDGSGSTETITPENGAVFEVLGHPNRNVTVTFSTATLINDAWATPLSAPTGSMTFTASVEETGSVNTYTSPNSVTSGNAYQADNVTGTGKLYLWVGGSIVVAAAQAWGDYLGTFTMNVAY